MAEGMSDEGPMDVQWYHHKTVEAGNLLREFVKQCKRDLNPHLSGETMPCLGCGNDTLCPDDCVVVRAEAFLEFLPI